MFISEFFDYKKLDLCLMKGTFLQQILFGEFGTEDRVVCYVMSYVCMCFLMTQ